MASKRVALFSSPEASGGIVSIDLYESRDVVAVRSKRQIRFRPPDAERDWERLVDGPGVFLSIRGGRLNVYRYSWTGRRRRFWNASPDPCALFGVVRETLDGVRSFSERERHVARRKMLVAVVERLLHMVDAAGFATPDPRRLGVPTAVASLAYPMVALAATSGIRVMRPLGTSVTPVLRAASARDAAEKAFGPRATRPVVAALARSLVSDVGEVVWPGHEPPLNTFNLGVALMGGCLAPDQIVTVLEARGPIVRPRGPFSAETVRAGRALIGRLHPRRATRLLCQAVEEDSGGLLEDSARMWETLDRPSDFGPHSSHLETLHDELSHRVFALSGGDHPTAFPREVRELHGRTVGDLRLVVPESTSELFTWGRQMRNCIGSCAQQAAAGRTWILGVERHDRLLYNIQVQPGDGALEIRGPSNRGAQTHHVDAVVDVLEEAGLLDGRVAPIEGITLRPTPRQDEPS